MTEFALEAVVSAGPYSNIHVRANTPEELAARLDALGAALDRVRLLAAESVLHEGGTNPTEVSGSASQIPQVERRPSQPSGQQQSYGRRKQTPTSGDTNYSDRVYLKVPFADKDRAKSLGARFDGERKQWYSTPKFNDNHEQVVAEFGAA